jgi:parallel beta-helix repeat protein
VRAWGIAIVLVCVCGCGESEGPFTANGAAPTPTATPVVRAGQSIQAAIDAAGPNSIITVAPGTYRESPTSENALTIIKDGVQLVGLSTPGNPVVLEQTGSEVNGIWVSPDGPADALAPYDDEHPLCGTNGKLVHGFALSGFTVHGFHQFGVYLACNDGFTLSNNVGDSNEFYDLFPVRSHNGVVSNNETLNTPKDAALYVGQSDHVMVTGNHSHDSLIGIEVENSKFVTVSDNETNGNTIGLLADAVPGTQQQGQSNVTFNGNNVHDNNRANTGEPPDFTAAIPPGTGILCSSGTDITVQANTVTGNDFGGIVVASYFPPYPDNVRLLDNTLSGNGLHPPPTPGLSAAAADIVWDGGGTGVCASGNTAAATVTVQSAPGSLPACQ